MEGLVSKTAYSVRKGEEVDFYETVKEFYSYMVKVVKPTPCNNYDLLDMNTSVKCCVKLENVSEAGDIMSRAYFGGIIGSILESGKADKCLNANDKHEKIMHICLTETSPAMMLYLTEAIVASELMGFKVVVHVVNIMNTNVLEIEHLVYAKMLETEFKYIDLPSEFAGFDEQQKIKWYEDYLNKLTEGKDYEVSLNYRNLVYYGIVGLACAAYEIVQQKDVSAIIVPNVNPNVCFSTLSAFALFAKYYNEKFPEKCIKIIPAKVEKDIEGNASGEFTWVLNHTPSLHAVPAFDYLLNLRKNIPNVDKEDLVTVNGTGKVTKHQFTQFFHSILDVYPSGAETPMKEDFSLYEFKKQITKEEEKYTNRLKVMLSKFNEKLGFDALSETKLIEAPLVVEEADLARGFMTSLRITRTYGGKCGVMGLSAALKYGEKIEGCYGLRSSNICVLLNGASVNPARLEEDLQWAQIMNGELFFIEIMMPSETEFMKKILSVIKKAGCNLVDLERKNSDIRSKDPIYRFRIGCNKIQERNNAYKALKTIEDITIVGTEPNIEDAKDTPFYDIPVLTLLSEYPVETDDHKFKLPEFGVLNITTEGCEAAEKRLLENKLIYPTPIVRSEIYSKLTNCNIYLQLDNLQQTGSFKQRGSANAILRGIVESGCKPRRVVAVSAGNHSQGVSLCCRYLGIPCTIVCPESAPIAKLEATRKYGAEVIPYGKSFEEAVEYGHKICDEHHATFVHPYDQEGVIEGQSTTAVAFHREVPDLDTILVNVGGGGLISGVASYLRRIKDYRTSLGKRLRIIGLQGGNVAPLDARDVTAVPIQKGLWKYVPMHNLTIADGCNVKIPGGIHDLILRDLIDEYYGVAENYIATAVAHLLVSTRTLVEGAGAIGVAAMMYNLIKVEPNEKVGIIVCGGNINIDHFVQCTMYGVRAFGRMLTFDVTLRDSHDSLDKIIEIAEACCMRFQNIQYLRNSGELAAEVATYRITLSSASFESQNEFLINLVNNLKLEPRIHGRKAIPHEAEIYKPFDDALEKSIAEKKAEFEKKEREWYEQELRRLKELLEKYPDTFLGGDKK